MVDKKKFCNFNELFFYCISKKVLRKTVVPHSVNEYGSGSTADMVYRISQYCEEAPSRDIMEHGHR